MSDLTPLLREAADALWLVPQHGGLAQRVQNAAESLSTPPIPSAEPVALAYTDSHGRIYLNESAPLSAIIAKKPSTYVPLYTTPPAAAQDTGRGISESVRLDWTPITPLGLSPEQPARVGRGE